MNRSLTARSRAGLAALAALGLALLAAPPAHAANGTPTTPTDLFNGYRNCATDPNAPTYLSDGQGILAEGVPGETDATGPTSVTEQYQVWPVADPTQITTVSHANALVGSEATVSLPTEVLTDGQTYAWRAQTVAGDTASDWSAPCYVTVDNTRPSNPPTVSSPNYPEGQFDQGGAPVQFTLGAGGVDDVAGYEYSWQQDLPVPVLAHIGGYGIPQPDDPYAIPRYFARADTVGGTATASLIPPSGSGPQTLWVVSLDRAWNASSMASYSFYVKPTGPTVTPLGASPRFGKPATFLLQPDPGIQSASPVVSYSVQTNDKTVDVPASPDGTAEVSLTLDGIYGDGVWVQSTSADGWVSDEGAWTTTFDTTPTVTSDVYPENGAAGGVGVPATFTFAPRVSGITSYTYSFNGGPETTVPAGPHHTADLTWTPDQSGYYDLQVWATTRDGLDLAPYDYDFTVN